MKANEVPEKLYFSSTEDGTHYYTEGIPFEREYIEYVCKDAFIEKAAQFLYNYNQKQVLKHGARATLGCGEYTINVDEFRKYIEGE